MRLSMYLKGLTASVVEHFVWLAVCLRESNPFFQDVSFREKFSALRERISRLLSAFSAARSYVHGVVLHDMVTIPWRGLIGLCRLIGWGLTGVLLAIEKTVIAVFGPIASVAGLVADLIGLLRRALPTLGTLAEALPARLARLRAGWHAAGRSAVESVGNYVGRVVGQARAYRQRQAEVAARQKAATSAQRRAVRGSGTLPLGAAKGVRTPASAAVSVKRPAPAWTERAFRRSNLGRSWWSRERLPQLGSHRKGLSYAVITGSYAALLIIAGAGALTAALHVSTALMQIGKTELHDDEAPVEEVASGSRDDQGALPTRSGSAPAIRLVALDGAPPPLTRPVTHGRLGAYQRLAEESDDGWRFYDGYEGTYRTVCVRMCDGFYWTVSFATTPDNFNRDSNICQSSCGVPAKLYVHQNPGERAEDLKDSRKQPYTALPNAFRFRSTYDPSCKCKAQPWEREASNRHRLYALEEASRNGDRSARRDLASLRKDFRRNGLDPETGLKEVQTANADDWNENDYAGATRRRRLDGREASQYAQTRQEMPPGTFMMLGSGNPGGGWAGASGSNAWSGGNSSANARTGWRSQVFQGN